MKKHRVFPFVLLVIFVPIALFSVFVIVANVVARDEAAPDISRLDLGPVRVADANNAYRDLEQILIADRFSDDIDQTLTSVVDAEGWDESYVDELLAAHEGDIAFFRQAAAKPSYQFPAYANPSELTLANIEFPNLMAFRKAAQVVALDARRRNRANDLEGGLAEALEIVKLGHAMEMGRGSLIDYLVGSSIKQTGLTTLRLIAKSSLLTADRAREISLALEAYRDSREGQVNAMKFETMISQASFPEAYPELVEQFFLSGTVDGRVIRPGFFDWVNSQIPPVVGRNSLAGAATQIVWTPIAFSNMTRFYYQPNETRRLAIEDGLERIAKSDADCADVETNPELGRHREYSDPRGFFQPNAIGNIVLNMGQISYGGLSTKRCNESLAVSATQLVLAGRAYTFKHGTPPGRLIDLVPDYLPEVPMDPYTGTPMHYDSEKRLAYSFGANRVDQGGSGEMGDWERADDPTFSLD
jgi:hypothetical protein